MMDIILDVDEYSRGLVLQHSFIVTECDKQRCKIIIYHLQFATGTQNSAFI
jgi:hypothetical protein